MKTEVTQSRARSIVAVGNTIVAIYIFIELGISDLVYICRKISIPKGNPKLIETRQFRHLSSTEFQSNLREAFFNLNHYNDPNLAWLR